MGVKTSDNGFLFDINNPLLDSAINNAFSGNNNILVVAATGNIFDTNLYAKMYAIRESFESDKSFDGDIKEFYSDDGQNFVASVSFVKKDW